ncbi:hypothetical protein DMC27_08305 [Vibrio parahaemolyticus]|nr:hypothetical protein [Vibrio parahaemolyticus]EGR3423688.1 hypothetical protein [Vibrio parahaemolyticus]
MNHFMHIFFSNFFTDLLNQTISLNKIITTQRHPVV